jgi:phospholipase/carboxylesterase
VGVAILVTGLSMNRIQSLPAIVPTPSVHGPDAVNVGAAQYSPPRQDAHFAFFAPLHYEPNYAYPLFVWLHGPADSESQLKRIMPLVSMRNYVGVAVRGTRRVNRPGNAVYSWSQSHADLTLAEQRVLDSIDLARLRFNIAPRRIFAAGFDCGGTMAFRLAMNHPRRFAGALSLGGAFPSGHGALAQLDQARRLALFVACGRESLTYPTLTVCDNLRLFHSAGMNVSLRQYPCGQEIAPQMLSDMDRWIMEQISLEASGPAKPH